MTRVGHPIPIACTLTPGEAVDRLGEWRALADDALATSRRAPRRLELRFRNEGDVRARAEALATAEAECCAFLQLTVDASDTEVVVVIAAPDGAEAVLDAFDRVCVPGRE